MAVLWKDTTPGSSVEKIGYKTNIKNHNVINKNLNIKLLLTCMKTPVLVPHCLRRSIFTKSPEGRNQADIIKAKLNDLTSSSFILVIRLDVYVAISTLWSPCHFVAIGKSHNCTALLWNSLPVSCFPATYNLSQFKRNINSHLSTFWFPLLLSPFPLFSPHLEWPVKALWLATTHKNCLKNSLLGRPHFMWTVTLIKDKK